MPQSDSVFIFLVVILTGLNVFQIWFWSRTAKGLIDRLMSRNYAEYIQTQALKQPLPMSVNIPPDEGDEETENHILNTLNGMVGR